MYRLRIKLPLLDAHNKVTYKTGIPVFDSDSNKSCIGTCKVKSQDDRNIGELTLDIEVSNELYLYYKIQNFGDGSIRLKGIQLSAAVIDTSDEIVSDLPAMQLKDIKA